MRPRWLIEEEGARPPLEPRAAQLLGALSVAVSDRLLDAMGSAAGLSPEALAALQWIDRAPGVHGRDLAKALGIGAPAISRLLGRLEAEGLIRRERERHDRRAARLRVSELGARRAGQASRARAHLTRSLVERLPATMRPRLIRMTELLLAVLFEQPGAGLEACRFCDWELCRGDPTAPCPLVLATASRECSSRPLDPHRSPVHEERRIVEGADPPIDLWLEPANVACRLDSRRRLEVVCRGPEGGTLEVERLPEGHLALYAWNGATFTVLEAGREIFVQDRALSLDMGAGETPRQRVESLFGDLARRREIPPARWL